MSRYIDADALIAKWEEDIKHITNAGFRAMMQGAINEVSNAPIADVVEVVHGENISKGGFLCSVCKFGDFNGFHGYEPNFCPNCGADMRGGDAK